MELLRFHLSRVRIPEPTNRIYKNECCVSYDIPSSEGGLYVDMSSFLAFGKEYVDWNCEKTGNPIYLHIQQRPKPVPEDRPLKKPTLLSIGSYYLAATSISRKALKASGGDIEKATDWIFSHPEASSSKDTDATSNAVEAGDPGVPDGSGRYKLMAFISHMGTSTHCGHYVAHVYKDGRWVIFNDSKVGASVDPPKDMGYLYFYERIAD